MKTIKLTPEEVATLRNVLNKIIPAANMLDRREFTPSYNEVMALIKLANHLNK